MDAFNQFWESLATDLQRGIPLRGWSVEQEYTDLQFTVVDVSSMALKVFSPGMKAPRSIGKGDFRTVWEAWPGYRAGQTGSTDLAQRSQNAGYIVGIMKWLEDRQ